MRYVAPRFTAGRVGHQISTVWQARLVAELFDLTYAHVPFEEHQWGVSGGVSPLGLWNDFLGLGRGELPLAAVREQLGTITYEPPANFDNWPACFSYDETWRLLDALPDNYVLLYSNLAPLSFWRVLDWQARGLATTASGLAVPCWFQRQLQQSAVYGGTARETPRGYRVAAYRRTALPGEALTRYHPLIPPAWFNDALAQIRLRYSDVDAVLYTQHRCGDESQLDPAWDVREVPDTYPATFEAFKDLVEADVAVLSVGGTSAMVELYRHGIAPTVRHEACCTFPGLLVSTIARELP